MNVARHNTNEITQHVGYALPLSSMKDRSRIRMKIGHYNHDQASIVNTSAQPSRDCADCINRAMMFKTDNVDYLFVRIDEILYEVI
jgi:hypothetical protein